MKDNTKEFLRTAKDGSVTNSKLAREILVEARFGEDFTSKISPRIPSYSLLYPDTFGEDPFDIEKESPHSVLEQLGLLGKVTVGFHNSK